MPTARRHSVGSLGLVLASMLMAAPVRADDWPAYARDAHRSNASSEPLAFPLRLAWSYQCAQPPRPAWPEPVKTLNRFDFDYAFHPVVAGGLVCFGSSADDTVRALSAETGSEKWHFIAGGPVRFAPQIAGGRVYFSADDGVVYCLDAATGTVVWKFTAAPADERMIGNERMISRWPARTGVLVDGGVVYATAGMWPADGVFVYALDAATGTVIWCNDTSGLIYDARTLHTGSDFATYGVCPQGALLASDTILLVPTGKALPAGFDRKTGQLLYYRIDADNNTQGGTWITIDGNKFHTTPYIISFALDSGRQVASSFGGGTIPDYAERIPGKAYSTYEKVSAIVSGGKAHARKASGMVLADTTLVIGRAGSVTAESAGPRSAADLRFARAGEDLAVLAGVADRRTEQGAKPWDGSCIEVFGNTPGQAPIGQVFLVPGTKTAPAVALRSQDGKVVPAPGIRIKSVATAKGYELSALIPLSHLALSGTSAAVRLEAQVTIPGPDGTRQRGTLFGSVTAHQDSARFGSFRLPPQAALASPDGVRAALSAAKPSPIVMGWASELWRADVDGEARGLAVANGRLFVSTSSGKVYCFEEGSGGQGSGARVQGASAESQASAPSHPPAAIDQLLSAGIDRGYALVVGDAGGDLATDIARASQLHVISVLTDEAAAQRLREKLLASTALYGSRVHVQVVPDLGRLPFADYFANAIVVAGPVPGLSAAELYRVLRPCGGLLLCPGLPAAQAEALVRATGAAASELSRAGQVVRGRLPGAMDWDSKFALDQRVKWPLRLLWFGGPGPAQVMDRKQFTDIGPVANGRLFVIGQDVLSAVDAYNGTVLWTRPVPKDVADLRLADEVHLSADVDRIPGKTYGRGLNADGSNVYLRLTGYFGTNAMGCVQMDARTGRQLKLYAPYAAPTRIALASAQSWPLEIDAAHSGTVTLRQDADGLLLVLSTTDPTITPLDRWDLYFDFRPAETRYGLYDRGVFSLAVFPANSGASASWKRGTGEAVPSVTVAGTREAGKTATTVRLTWAELAGLTGGKPASFGFGVRLNACDSADTERVSRRYLFCDLAADGVNNGWANVVLDGASAAATAAPAVVAGPYTSMPALPIDRGRVPVPGSQPAAQAPRRHPLTGEATPKLYQPGGMCGGPAYSAFVRFDRSTAIAIYDFADDSGTRTFDGVKPGCATTMTVSQGLLLSVEGRGGCTCTFNYQTSLALAPVEKRWNEDWALFFDRDADSRVVSAALNLGAPGDRRAADGTLWLSFPRIDKGKGAPATPPNVSAIGVGNREMVGNLRVPLTVETYPDGGTYRFNADRTRFRGTDRPWLYASGYRGIRKATLKLDCGTSLISAPVAQAPVLDGRADAAIREGAPQAVLPVSKTDIRFRHDASNLYVFASRPAVIAKKGESVPWVRDAPKPGPRDDQSFYNDCCWELFLGDARSGRVMHLRLMTTGARFDALSESPAAAGENVKWNGAWASAVAADDNEFSLEMAIPWKTLTDAGLDTNSLAVNAMMNGPFRQSEALRFVGMRGRDRCESFVPLGLGQAPAGAAARPVTVRLHFAEPDADARAGQRVFDVRLQGQTVLTAFDIVKEAGAPRTALVKEFTGVQAGAALTLEFEAAATAMTAGSAPVLCGLELIDEAARPQ